MNHKDRADTTLILWMLSNLFAMRWQGWPSDDAVDATRQQAHAMVDAALDAALAEVSSVITR